VVRIEPFLLDDEVLLGSCGTGRGLVCATDLRLLRVERSLIGRRVRDLSYGEISSIWIADEVDWLAVVVGLVAGALGLAIPRLAARAVAVLDLGHPMRLTAQGELAVWVVSVVLLGVGAVLLGYGLIRRRPYVALHGPGLLRQRRHRAAWHFATPTPSDARVFAMLVRGRVGPAARVAEKKVLPFDTV
jgi:hypothetical protein